MCFAIINQNNNFFKLFFLTIAMFGFLKDKLKSVVDKFTKKVEEEGKEEIIEVKKPQKETKKEEKHKPKEKEHPKKEEKHKPRIIKEEEIIEEEKHEVEQEEILEEKEIPEFIEEKPEQKQGFFSKLFKKKEEKEEKKEEKVEQIKEVFKEEKPAEEQEEALEEFEEQEIKEKKGFFASITEKITTKKLSQEQFDEIFWDLELALLESNVAVEVIEKIKIDLSKKLVEQPLKKSQINEIIINSLREAIDDVLTIDSFNLMEKIKLKKPFIICFVGINGSGKTTTIAKIAHYLQKNKLTCVIAAADTFRAAAIQQLEEHANNLNVKLIKHDYGADAAAVAFDAIKHAEARHIDVVLIDTAGRLHSNEDLMKEMQKIIRIAKPDLKLFIGESITGNDCVEQAKKFNESIGIDGIILAKADVDDKGGAAISISYVTKKPILFLGTGQKIDDLKEFNKEEIIKSLGL